MPSPLDHGNEYFFITFTEKPDGQGGTLTDWGIGEEFVALRDFDNSTQGKIAEVQGVKSLYTFSVDRSLEINYGDLFVGWDDQDYGYRVTSRPKDQEAPEDSDLDFKVFSAENYDLPDNISDLFAHGAEYVNGRINLPDVN